MKVQTILFKKYLSEKIVDSIRTEDGPRLFFVCNILPDLLRKEIVTVKPHSDK